MDKYNNKIKRYIICILLVLITIFIFSFQTMDKSRALSEIITEIIKKMGLEVIVPQITDMGLEGDIRKMAHIFLFFCLGITSCILCIYLFNKIRQHRILITGAISAIFCLLCACIDEIHQNFVPGRHALISDIGYDAIGFIVGIVIVIVLTVFRGRQKL